MEPFSNDSLCPIAEAQGEERRSVAGVPSVPKRRGEFRCQVRKSFVVRNQRPEDRRYRLNALIHALLEPQVRDSNVPVRGDLVEVGAQLELAEVHVSSSCESGGWLVSKTR